MLPHLDDFLLYLKVNNFSPETAYNYERDLRVFERFLKEDVGINDFKNANKQTLELYKAYLASQDRKTSAGAKNTRNLGAYSRNRHLSSLRGYLRYLIEMDFQTPILPENVKLIKTEKKILKVAELDDLVRLIEFPIKFERNPVIAKRNHAMLEVIFSTGLRISELVNLKKHQIDNKSNLDSGLFLPQNKDKRISARCKESY